MSNHTCRRGSHGVFWLVVLVIGVLYWLGRKARPAKREPAVAPIDDPAVTEAWQRVARLPQFRVAWALVARRALHARRNVRVLDVGSGGGQLVISLAKRPEVHTAVGIDLADEMVHTARHAAELQGVDAEFLQVDAAEMPFEDNAFDVVVSTLSLHHWSNPRQVLSEIHRVLAPGGKVVILDLRRDAPAVFYGIISLVSRYIVPQPLRDTGEPLTSLQAAYTPWEAVLLAAKAGWQDPRVSTLPIGMLLEAEKEEM